MNQLIDILAKLDELTAGAELHSDGAIQKALCACIATSLRADSCVIRLADEVGEACDAMPVHAEAMEAPIATGSKHYGSICVHGLQGTAGPKQAEQLQIIAWCIARAFESNGMRCVLRSRFAQLAIAKRSGVRALVAASAQHPDKTARLLARTFYLELARSGFSCNQIINAAGEIISQLSLHLQQQKCTTSRTQASVASIASASRVLESTAA